MRPDPVGLTRPHGDPLQEVRFSLARNRPDDGTYARTFNLAANTKDEFLQRLLVRLERLPAIVMVGSPRHLFLVHFLIH